MLCDVLYPKLTPLLTVKGSFEDAPPFKVLINGGS